MKKLQDYQPYLERIFDKIIHEYDFVSKPNLQEVFRQEQKVVTILNHSTPLSWLPAICLLVQKICSDGGGKRVPVGVMDKFFFKVPLFKPVAEYLTQFEVFPSFEDIVRGTERGYTDVAIFPEGSNCFFGKGEIIQPFRSPRFIELALKMKARIYLAVHRGSEDWALSLDLKNKHIPFQAYLPGWLNEKIHSGGFFVIPTVPKKIPRFRMVCDFYEPRIQLEDLSTKRSVRMRQLWDEAERVRLRMQEMFDSLEAS